jgi:hypothetical protein
MTRNELRRILEYLRGSQKVVGEAKKLCDLARSVGSDLPFEGLEAALVSVDSMTRPLSKQAVPAGSSPFRLLREDLVVGKSYIIHHDGVNCDVEFEYLGPSWEDSIPNGEQPSFRAVTGGLNNKHFYADYGLEPYKKHSKDPWWNKSNWVGPTEIDQEMLTELISMVDVDDLVAELDLGGDLVE